MTAPPAGVARARCPARRAVLVAGAAAALGAGGVTAVRAARGPAPGPATLVLATGPLGAVFVEVGRDVARAVEALAPGTRVRTLVTAASVDNLALLAAARADLGLASLDAVAVDPRAGPGSITTVGRVYDSVLHLVVPAASPVRTLAGCGGRRVSVGAAGSGTEFTTRRLLVTAGVRPGSTVRLAQAEAMAALAAGSIEAAFSLTGFPTPAISDLARRAPVRLVPLPGAAPALGAGLPRVYSPAVVPAGIYPGIVATPTVAVPNLLLVRPGLPDAAVSLVTAALLSAGSRRFWTHPDSRRIDVRTAIATGPVPLHPAAVAWLRAHKP